MNRTKLVLIAALFGAASTAALAADAGSESARRDRMDMAYENYRNTDPGPAARAERSIKRGAKKVGHAVREGARKTGKAIRRGGEKLERKSAP